jgi:hypothetical protein
VDIEADYALTDLGAAKFTAWLRQNRSNVLDHTPPAYYVVTPPEAMQLFLTELRARYGSVQHYLASAGVAPDHVRALRAHLLI